MKRFFFEQREQRVREAWRKSRGSKQKERKMAFCRFLLSNQSRIRTGGLLLPRACEVSHKPGKKQRCSAPPPWWSLQQRDPAAGHRGLATEPTGTTETAQDASTLRQWRGDAPNLRVSVICLQQRHGALFAIHFSQALGEWKIQRSCHAPNKTPPVGMTQRTPNLCPRCFSAWKVFLVGMSLEKSLLRVGDDLVERPVRCLRCGTMEAITVPSYVSGQSPRALLALSKMRPLTMSSVTRLSGAENKGQRKPTPHTHRETGEPRAQQGCYLASKKPDREATMHTPR